MALLAGTCYDPASAGNAVTTSRIAMTALDTTNLRLTFTVPANGIVLVRLAGVVHGATSSPQILLGVLEGATIRGRSAGINSRANNAAATTQLYLEATFVVTGLTPGASLTWDAAYGVEVAVASTGVKYGGADDTTADTAFGGFVFEVWEAAHLLAGKLYDPGTAVTNKSCATAAVMTALDTTNLRLTFTAPASGKVLVRLACMVSGGTANPVLLLGVLDGATVKGRVSASGLSADVTGVVSTSHLGYQGQFLVTGLTPGNSYTWDAAYGVEVVTSSANIKYGGPDNTTLNDAFGGFAYEIWTA